MVKQLRQMSWMDIFKNLGVFIMIGSSIVYITIYITNIKSDVRFAITSINNHVAYNNNMNEYQAKINAEVKAKTDEQEKALAGIQTKLEVAVTILERIDVKVGKP